MKSSKRDALLLPLALVAGCVLLFAFQNCAPQLPLDGVVSNTSASTRATASPTPNLSGIGSNGTYTGSVYDGQCDDSATDDAMALTGNDIPAGTLVAFNYSGTTKAAFWNLSSGAIAHATVCTMNLSGYSVQAIGDFNGDLNKDILWRNASGQVIIWLMRGATRLQTALVGTISTAYNIEGVADIDGDGKEDIIVRDGSNNFAYVPMNGVSSFGAPVSLSTVSSSNIHLSEIGFYVDPSTGLKKRAFFFKDAGSSTNLPVWFLNGSTVSAQTLPTGLVTLDSSGAAANFTVMGFGDFNGDGNTDLFLQNTSSTNYMLRYLTYNSGTGDMALLGDSGLYLAASAAWVFQGDTNIAGDLFSDWTWVVNGGTYPLLAFTPIANSTTLSSIGYIRPGYTFFKYTHR